MHSTIYRFLLLLLILIAIAPASAEVIDSTATGFTVKHSLVVKASPDSVYRHFVEDYGIWWEDAHTWSGDASNFSLDARRGGCLCEKLPNGGGVKHLEVIYVDPGKMIRLQGGLGPLQAMAVTGTLTWSFAAIDEGTQLTLSYTVGGYIPGGMQQLAAPVDYVLGVQIKKLKEYVEMMR